MRHIYTHILSLLLAYVVLVRLLACFVLAAGDAFSLLHKYLSSLRTKNIDTHTHTEVHAWLAVRLASLLSICWSLSRHAMFHLSLLIHNHLTYTCAHIHTHTQGE